MTTNRRVQFRVTLLLAITAMVAVTLALLRHFNPFLLLSILAIPFAFVLEMLTTGLGVIAGIRRQSQLRRLSIVVLLSTLLAGLSFWTLSAGYPTIVRPLPFLTVIPAFYELPLGLIIGIPSFAFALTVAPNIWLQHGGLPIRFQLLLFAGTLASVYWLGTGWSYAVQYQSRGYAIGVAAVNFGFLFVLWLLVWRLRHARSFTATLGFATILFLWFYAAAFPWMGELP